MNVRRLGVLMAALAVTAMGLVCVLCGGPVVATLLDLAGPARAMAQATTMTFENVAPESVAALLERSGGRPRSRVRVTVSTDASEAGDTMGVPVPVVRTGDMTRVGDDIHIERNEVVHGDVVGVMGSDVVVDGTVNGDVVAVMGGDVYLNATARVDGDVVCIGGELHEEPGAYVSGKRVTGSGPGLGIGAGRLRDWERDADRYGVWGGLRLIGAFFRFLLAIGLSVLVAWLFQHRIASGVATMKRQPGLSLGVGALVLALIIPSVIALAVVMVLLAITLIGIPLAVVAVLGYALFFVVFGLFGLTIGATVVGEWLTSRRGGTAKPVWQSALLGALLVAGTLFLGRMFEIVGVFGFGALGLLLTIPAATAAFVLGTIGGGAWIKWEFSEGMLAQWWGRWQGRGGRLAPPAPGAPPAGAAPPPAPPPGAYTPPEAGPPPPGAGSGA